MDLSNLTPAEGSTKQRKRVGRGQGSGRGGTSTRGHNGAKSRSGYSRKIGFEGGQMPLQKRVPKFGFTNINRKEFKGVNLDTLQFLVDTKKVKAITKEVLVENGIVSKKDLVKVLGRGELTAKLEVTVDAFSASAKSAIEKAGGKANALVQPKADKPQEEVKPKTAVAPKAAAKVKEETKKEDTKPEGDKSTEEDSTEG
jgi:large subunit ribosomal protein L15